MLIRPFTILFITFLYSIYLAASPSTVFSQGSGSKHPNSKICSNLQQYINENEDSEVKLVWNKWSPEEEWAWEHICKGEPADFNKRYKKKLDPAKEMEWTENDEDQRELTSSFLETILLKKLWRELIPHDGVHIIGAWFGDDINLENAELKHQLKLEESRFEGKVKFARAASSFGMSFKKSFFSRQFNISWAKIKGPLEMDGVMFFPKQTSKGAFVQETPIEKKKDKWVFMRGLVVDSDLIMNDGIFPPVDLQLAK